MVNTDLRCLTCGEPHHPRARAHPFVPAPQIIPIDNGEPGDFMGAYRIVPAPSTTDAEEAARKALLDKLDSAYPEVGWGRASWIDRLVTTFEATIITRERERYESRIAELERDRDEYKAAAVYERDEHYKYLLSPKGAMQARIEALEVVVKTVRAYLAAETEWTAAVSMTGSERWDFASNQRDITEITLRDALAALDKEKE